MKRSLCLLLTALLLVLTAVPAAARPPLLYPVTFNGHPVRFDVQPEVLPPGHTMVPLRAIFEAMGAAVEYDPASRTVTARRDPVTVRLTIGQETAYVNGTATRLPKAPYIKESRTLVPLRFVGEAFGAAVTYSPETTAITIVDERWPRRGGVLHLALRNRPASGFNPIAQTDTYTAQITELIYDRLWRYDDRSVPVPALAESWAWSESNTRLTFYLRKGVTFFDGRELTAEDVVFTYKALLHPRYPGPHRTGWDGLLGYAEYRRDETGDRVTGEGIAGLYAEDRYTVVFRLREPDSRFFVNQVTAGILDSQAYAVVPVQDWGTAGEPNSSLSNGTGPFRLSEAVTGQRYVLTANERYWGGRPYIDQVIWQVLSPEAAGSELQSGRLDLVEVTPGTLPALEHVQVHQFPDLSYQMMLMNRAAGPTAEKAVRQAISHAIDRGAFVNGLLKGYATPMATPLHPLAGGGASSFLPYPFSPEKARQLLEEAGWKPGPDGIRVKDGQQLRLRLVYPQDGNTVRIASAALLQRMLHDVGVAAEPVGTDWSVALQHASDRAGFDLLLIGVQLGSAAPGPGALWEQSAIAPELLARAGNAADAGEEGALYRQWEERWAEEAPAYIFYAEHTLLARHERLRGLKPGPWGTLWNIAELWIDE